VTVADPAQSGQLQAGEKRVADDTALELLVNNASFGGYRPVIALDPERAAVLIGCSACGRPWWGVRWQGGGKESTDGDR
jgi:short-subunit dehydrogenase